MRALPPRLASAVLGRLVAERDFTVHGAPLRPDRPVPGSLSPFALRCVPVPPA